MNAIRIALLASAGLLTLVACTDGVGFPDDEFDTGFDSGLDDWYEGPLQIDLLDYQCSNGSPDEWWFYARSNGYAGLMTLDIFETGDGNWPSNPAAVWDESHDMSNTDWDDNGEWDEWELVLDETDTIGGQISGRTTLFDCAWNDGGSLAFMITMYGDTGGELDCAIWGHESQQYFNGHRGESCVCFDYDGSCTN